MIGGLKRRRILREREEAATERSTAAKAFVAALRNAEDALEAMKLANDKFYRSDRQIEQASLSALRRERERLFMFNACGEIVAEAPRLAQLAGLKRLPGRAMPLVAFVEQCTSLDLNEVKAA